ncbi:Late embryogenesis abundant protein, LEA-14 [Spatholobus suberectus]|nr:Late embryogenesis abundant protein, LEA-14 [Spatholobus suberectus]
MASSNQERGDNNNSQTEPPPLTNQSSNKHIDPPPITTTYPMYYPNPHAYPQYPTGYHYPQTTPYYGPPPTTSAGTRFYRSFIICSCVVLTCICLSSLALALVLRPELPVYKVVSMSVTNFTTTPTLAGQWGAKITVENPNDKLVAYFTDFKVDVAYKDGVVAVNHAPGFVLNRNDKVEVDVTGLSNQASGSVLEKTMMEDLVKERGTGSVTFALRVFSVNMFKSDSFSTRSKEIVAVCESLKVVFQNNNNATGTLDNGGKPVECQIVLEWKIDDRSDTFEFSKQIPFDPSGNLYSLFHNHVQQLEIHAPPRLFH